MDTFRNGCLGKMDDYPVHITPNHHSLKMDVLLKTFLKIILAGKWLLRHSRIPTQIIADIALSSG